ncbi:MAG TPA: glycosyltransferase, partial [Microvirga sp.]
MTVTARPRAFRFNRHAEGSTMTADSSHPGLRAGTTGAKPRILLFVSNLGVGGAERHTVKLRACLRDRGYPTSLLVHGPHRSAVITALDGSEGAVHLDIKGIPNPMGWLRIWRAFHAQRADIVIAVNQTPLIVAILARILCATRAKIACIFHTTILRPSEERRIGLFRWMIGRADALVYISRNQQRYWEGHGLRCRDSATILNGIDLDRFDMAPQEREAARARLGFEPSDVVFGLVAAFRPEKNHGQLVEAAARLRQEGIRAKVLFVGDG